MGDDEPVSFPEEVVYYDRTLGCRGDHNRPVEHNGCGCG
jgi:hypothetical protein